MRLSRVQYEMFESDAKRLAANQSSPFHEVDREIHIFTEDQDFFVSWIQTDNAWRIVVKPESFYEKPAEITQDYSSHGIWSPLVGGEFELIESGPENLALQFLGEGHSVFCCPYENGNWGADVIHIATRLPVEAT